MTSSRRARNRTLRVDASFFILAMIGFGIIGCWPNQRKAMDFTTLTYTVGDIPETTQTLTIKASGEARFASGSNEHMRERPEIGLYETTLNAKALASLKAMLERSTLAELPDHTGIMPEGIRSEVIRLTTPSSEIVKRVSSADPIDARLKEVLEGLDKLALEVMKHPRMVLRAGIASPAVSPPGNLSLEFELTNLGRDELWFRSAWDIVQFKDGWVRIEVWPAVPEPGSMWSEQKVIVQPTKVEPVEVAGEQPGIGVFLLRARETMRFKLTGFFYGKSGSKYVARVDYCNFKDKLEGQTPIVGEVLTKTAEFSFP